MRTAKRTGIAALFAVFFALLLAGCLCLGLPAKREAQAAEGAVSEEEITYNDPSIEGISTPAELMAAYAEVVFGQATDSTITLAGNIQLDMVNDDTITGVDPNGHLELPESVTFDLNGNTLNIITGGELCINIGQTVEGTTLTQSTVTIKNGTLIGQSGGHFAIVQAGSTLNLSDVDVQFKNAGGDEQTTRPAAVAVNDGAILNVNNVKFSKLENAGPVFVGDYPAYQGTVNFTSDDPLTKLRDQINASSDDHQIETTLTADITGSLVVPEYANITIDLNGKTITNTAEQGQYATITNHGTLIIDGSNGGAVKATSAAKMSSSNDDDYTPYAVYNYGMLTAKNATITAEATASGTSTEDPDKPTASVYIRAYGIYNDAGSATLENCTVSASSASTSSYAVYNTKGALSITNGAFTAGKAELTTSGTPLYSLNSGSSVTVKGGTFTANGSSPYGIYVKSAQKAEIIGATVTSSKVGIYFYNIVETAKLSDSQVTVNAKTSKSYNVYVYGCGLEMDSVQLKTTASGTTAHGVYTGSLKSLTIKGNSSIETTSDNGSLVPLSINGTDAEVNLEQCSIPNGAIEVDGGATVNISGGQFGGVELDVRKGAFHITGGTFDSVPDLTMLADNYAIYKKNGKYVVKTDDGNATLSKNNVAMIGDTGYNTLSDAIGAAQEGQTVTLLKSVEEDVTVSSGAVTLDLNGNTLTGNISVSGGSLSVVGSGKVTGTVGATDGTLQISGGSYANLIAADYLAEGYVLKASRNSDGVLTVEVVKGAPLASMMIGETEYKFIDLASALSAAPYDQSSEIVLLQDITLDADDTLTIYLENKEIKLDLGGKTIEATVEFDRGTSSFITVVNGAKLTICNGTIKRVAPANDGAVALIDVHSHNAGAPAKLTLKQDLTIEQSGNIAIFIYGYATLNTAAKIHVTGDGVIQSNGSENYAGKTVINITGGELTSDDDVAIFHPQNGELNISGGTVSGATAIYMRSGSLNVSGDAVIKATGAKNEGYPESGYTATGDAIVIRSSNYPGGAPVPSITGGTISSESASAVVSTAVEGAAAAENFISNGTFSEELPVEYLDEGIAQIEGADGNYTVGDYDSLAETADAVAVVKETGKAYTSLQDAIDAAGEGATVTLLKNVTESVKIEKDKNITIDLNGQTLTGGITNYGTLFVTGEGTVSSEKYVIIFANYGELTVENGTFKTNGNAVVMNTGNASNPAGTVTIKGGTFETTGTATYVYTINNSGTLNIEGGTFKTGGNFAIYSKDGSGIDGATNTIKITGGTIDGGITSDVGAEVTLELGGSVTVKGNVVVGQQSEATLSGGTYEGKVTVTGTAKITGGTYKGKISNGANESGKLAISDGEFDTAFPSAYLAENAVLVKTAEGFKALDADSEAAKDYVAEVSDPDAETAVRYETLAEAITAAKDGDTVKLLKNIGEESAWKSSDGSGNLQFYAEDGREVTLDFGGHTVYSGATTYLAAFGGTLKLTNGSLYVYGTGIQITANSPSIESKVILTDSFRIESYNQSAVFMTTNGNTDEKNLVAVLESAANLISWNTNNNTSQECWATIQGNGTQHGTKINITGGSVVNKKDVAIYHPQYGELTISGGEVYGETTGIEIRAGKLVVEGGKITGNGNPFTADPNGNGSTTVGAAVAVSQHSTNFELNATITGGELIGARALFEIDLQDENVSGISLNVEGGTFNGEVISENVENFIEGGDFNTAFPSAYLAKNAVLVKTADGFKALDANSEAAKAYVAEVSDPDAETAVRYETLAAAINAAEESGGTVKLLKNVEINEAITIRSAKTLSFDLNGKKITGGDIKKLFTISATSVTFGNGTIEAENQVFEIAGGTGLDGKTVTFKDDLSISSKNEVAVFIYQSITLNTSAKITAKNAAIMGNGTDTKYAEINVTGGEITSTNAVAMYLPAKSAEVTISGGVVTGTTGIEVRGGTLNIKDGAKIVATGETLVAHREGGGASVLSGAAVAVSKYASSNSLKVNITGGTLKGLYAFYEAELNATQSEVTGLTLSITGGTFNGDIASENVESFISGKGVKFSEMPKMDYFAENYIAEYNAGTGKYETKEGSWVAAIGEEGYATLQDAINAAEEDDVIELRADVPLTEALTIDKSVTIDLAGHTINAPATAANITANATIKSSEEGGTIKHTGEGKDHGLIVTNDATLTLESVTVDYKGAGQAIRLGDYNSGTPTENGGNAVLKNVTVTGGIAGVAMFGTEAGFANGTSLTATNSNISGTVHYGIATNGSFHNNTITLTDTNVSAPEESGTAMYLPGEGETTITGGTIKGATGIEIRAGKLTINEGTTIIATGDYEEPEANPSGTTVGGVAVAVSQHTTQLAINVAITGGTFNATGKDGKAFLEIDTVEKEDAAPSEGVTASITGGTFNASVEARNITGFIKGGDFGVKPADKLMNEDYAAEYVNGRYVAVPSTALKEARLAAQADVRAYAAAKGIDWSQIEAAAEDESAVKVLAAYNAIAEAMSTLAVAEAKLDAMAAVDDYAAAIGEAFAKLVADAIAEIKNEAAASEDRTAVVVPTATYAAIYAAETEAELTFLKDNALKEIKDIRAYRGEIAAQAEKLEALKGAIAAIDDGLFGTDEGAQGAIEAIQDAIKAAQDAITGGDETTSTSLKEIYEYLDGTLKGAVDGIREMLTDAVSEGGILHEMQTTLEALDTTVNGDGAEGPALLDQLTAAIEAAQNAINGNTATEMDGAVEKITAAITAAQNAIIAALPDYEETLGKIAGSVDKLEDLLGGTNGLAAIKKGIDDALAAIGTADGDTTLFEQLAAIESGNTAIKTTVDGLAAALTGKDGAIATLTAALTAMQGDITKLTGALAEDTGWVAKDIAAAQSEIDKLTAAVGKLGTVDGKDLAAVVGEIADGLEEMDATVNSIASTVSAASAVEEAKTQAAADIRTWLEGYLEELAGDTAQADVLARAAYTAETTEGELYKDISAQFGEENGKLVLKYYNEALAAIDAATTVSDVTTAVATFRAQVASIEASAGNSTDLTVVYVLLGVVLLVLIIACIVALVKGGRKPEPAPAQAAPAEKPAEAQPEEKAEEKEEQAEEAAPAEEPAEEKPAEEESAAAEDDDKERVVISANVRTFDEAYQDLTDEQRELFNKVKEYALAKEDAVEVKQSGGVVIKRKSKQIVKLTVRRDMPVALFLLENEMLKDFRRNAKSEAKLKVRATELVIREADDLETAYTMVDLSVEQIEKDLEAAKERRREARRQRRLQRQAEEAAAEQAEEAEEPAPADEPASAESAATDGTDTE